MSKPIDNMKSEKTTTQNLSSKQYRDQMPTVDAVAGTAAAPAQGQRGHTGQTRPNKVGRAVKVGAFGWL
jgi:hypothetical protein